MTHEDQKAEVLVLLSGGIDSATCVAFFTDLNRPTEALFVDYQQPAAQAEFNSARSVAAYYDMKLLVCTVRSPQPTAPGGFIPGRNALLIGVACLNLPRTISTIALGIHDGTGYPDCTSEFAAAAEQMAGYSRHGPLRIAAPFRTWRKNDIVKCARRLVVPIHLTYSCEVADVPCGSCPSCKDRAALCSRDEEF